MDQLADAMPPLRDRPSITTSDWDGRDVIVAEAPRSDAAGRLTDTTIAALKDRGLFGLLVPRAYGGMQLGAVETLEILEAVCEADGSTGWVAMAANVVTGVTAAFLPDTGAESVFANGVPVIAGQGAPRGRAVADGKGYRLSGTWSYGSGVLHSDYIHTGGMVYENGKPTEPMTFIIPTSEATLLGNWDVIGLRATGSVDYALQDIYVPREFTHSPNTLTPLRGSEIFRLGIVGLTPLGHGAFALGVGRRILDELAALYEATDGRPAALVDGTGESFQDAYGAAEGQLRAGRAFVYEAFGEAEATVATGTPATVRQITLLRLALNQATSAAVDVCAFAYRAGGGVALRSGILQRCFRDMMAGSQHRIVSPYILRECSKELLGLVQGKMWTSNGLIDPPPAGRPH